MYFVYVTNNYISPPKRLKLFQIFSCGGRDTSRQFELVLVPTFVLLSSCASWQYQSALDCSACNCERNMLLNIENTQSKSVKTYLEYSDKAGYYRKDWTYNFWDFILNYLYSSFIFQIVLLCTVLLRTLFLYSLSLIKNGKEEES